MNCYKTAQYLAREIEAAGPFRLLYRGDPVEGIPALTWTLEEGADVPFNLYDFADRLRNRGWQVPAYALPPGAEGTVVQRILVRQGFGLNMARLFLEDFRRTVDYFARHGVGSNLTQQEAGASTTDLASAAGDKRGHALSDPPKRQGEGPADAAVNPANPLSPHRPGRRPGHLCRCWAQALLAVEVTRSHPEGLKGAEATASAIYPAHRPPENA